jgi:hypothetical protein
MRLGLLRQSQVIARVGRAGGALLPARGKSFQSKLANRLEHAVAGLAGWRLGLDEQALLDERTDPVRDATPNLTCSGRHGRDCFQIAAASQHGKAPEERLLISGQQVIALANRVPHRLQTDWLIPWPAGENRQRTLEMTEQCLSG